MDEKKYRVCLTVPLGRRDGSLTIRETDGRAEGRLDVMGEKNPFAGQLSGDGTLKIAGTLRTLVDIIPYTATGKIAGGEIRLTLKAASGAEYAVCGKEMENDDETV